ncbi:MAG: carbonic anhydrase family protein [Methylocystis sp.]
MAFTRRSFLAGLASCPLCAAAAKAEGAHWSYDDVRDWGAHDSTNQACAIGGEQSPVDLTGAIKADIHAPALSWRSRPLKLANNGHTIQANVEPGSFATADNRAFEFKQFHFHTPSEHTVDGKRAAMEAHFVHAGAGGELLVLGALMQAGGSNDVFSTLMKAAPPTEGEVELKQPLDAEALLPKSRHFFRYEGSLTTPPCSEVVNWYVFATPIAVAEDDIKTFAKLFPMNARPLQPLHRRVLLTD